jgi:hypothetical protein
VTVTVTVGVDEMATTGVLAGIVSVGIAIDGVPSSMTSGADPQAERPTKNSPGRTILPASEIKLFSFQKK